MCVGVFYICVVRVCLVSSHAQLQTREERKKEKKEEGVEGIVSSFGHIFNTYFILAAGTTECGYSRSADKLNCGLF